MPIYEYRSHDLPNDISKIYNHMKVIHERLGKLIYKDSFNAQLGYTMSMVDIFGDKPIGNKIINYIRVIIKYKRKFFMSIVCNYHSLIHSYNYHRVDPKKFLEMFKTDFAHHCNMFGMPDLTYSEYIKTLSTNNENTNNKNTKSITIKKTSKYLSLEGQLKKHKGVVLDDIYSFKLKDLKT